MIVEHLNEYYARKGNTEREPYRVRPSGFGDCVRKIAFLLDGKVELEPLPAETLRVFEDGHSRGARHEGAAKAIWPDAQTQVPVVVEVGRHKVPGTCDLWIPSTSTIVDFKGKSVYGFGKLDEEGPDDQDIFQIHAYRVGLSATRCILVYEAKDSDARKGIRAGQMKEIEVPWTDELEGRYRARIALLSVLLDSRELGTLDPYAVPGLERGHWKCKTDRETGKPLYCPIGPIRGRCHG